jgi:hypothetical protein
MVTHATPKATKMKILETPFCHAYVSKLQKLLARPTSNRANVVPVVVTIHNEKKVFN